MTTLSDININHEKAGQPLNYTTDLVSLLAGICDVPSGLNTTIHGVQIDSRKVQKGDLFLALSGDRSTSTDHIVEAIERGANAVVAEGRLLNGRVFENRDAVELFVDDLKQQTGTIAGRFFKSPSRDLSVVGVTGTNGKTSVTNYLQKYFSLSGIKAGVIGTLGYGVADEELKDTEHTTPNVVDINRYLAELRDCGARFVAMEVSSHGLSQGRVDGIRFEGAVFTNLTREHLDYHGTMQEYAKAKSVLFQGEGLKFAVVNNDDDFAKSIIKAIPSGVEVLTYGVRGNADIRARNYKLNTGIRAEVNTPLGVFNMESSLIGGFNLSNLLAVAGVAVAKGMPLESLAGLKEITPVEGRMEQIKLPGYASVIVDYAHTPDALKNVLEALRPHCTGRMVVVFGCGGERDIGKRPEMAAIAEAYADEVIVTDDNPRNENAGKITEDILSGFSSLENVRVVPNRKLAIVTALKDASENDVVLIAGKGHETWQEVMGKRSYFSDIDEVNQYFGLSGNKEQGAEGCK